MAFAENKVDRLELELLANRIEQALHWDTERASDILARIKEQGLTFEVMGPAFHERPATWVEIEAAAQMLEAQFVANGYLAPIPAFETLSYEVQEEWVSAARRFYSNSVFHPIQMAEQLYAERDGELPEPIQVAPEDVSFSPYNSDFCIEWHPPGQLPGHRAEVMIGEPMVYPLAVTTVIEGFEPTKIRAREARIWPLPLVYLDGKLTSPRQIKRQAWARGESPRQGATRWPNSAGCYLVEVFGNHGDDGWTAYTLDGYAVMTASQLAEYIGKVTGRGRSARKSQLETILDEFGKR